MSVTRETEAASFSLFPFRFVVVAQRLLFDEHRNLSVVAVTAAAAAAAYLVWGKVSLVDCDSLPLLPPSRSLVAESESCAPLITVWL